MSVTPQGFDTLASLLKTRSGLSIGPEKLYLLETRLLPILRRENLQDLTALAQRLRCQASASGKLADDVVRPIIFHDVAAACWHPYVKNMTIMVNSIYNGWRWEDVWLDK